MPGRNCTGCGSKLSPPKGAGRPRTKCESCSPPRKRDIARRAPHKLALAELPAPLDQESETLESSTRAALTGAKLADDPAGIAALVLARRIDSGSLDTGAGLAALVREHRAALSDAMSRATVEADPLERLRLVVADKMAGA